MPTPDPTPNWKEIILSSPDWPEDLVIPQNDPLPEDSEIIQESIYANEHWEWELWRHPDGHCYYLKAWRMSEDESSQPGPLGTTLTVMEAFQFLMSNLMPRDVIADLAFARPDLVQSFKLPPGAPGLN